MKKTNAILMTAAVAGLLLGAGSPTTVNAEDAAKGECWGVNGCKGQGDCAGKGHSCAGENSCKGKGWVKMTKADCEAKGGDFRGG